MPQPGYSELTLPSVPGRAARVAKLSVRFDRVVAKPSKQLEKSGAAPVSITYVDLREETPPEGTDPIHWRLLTTYDITTVEEVLDVANRYAKRWKIEELFLTMKPRGFDIEGLRTADNAHRNKLILA